jgi:hypothetical protein
VSQIVGGGKAQGRGGAGRDARGAGDRARVLRHCVQQRTHAYVAQAVRAEAFPHRPRPKFCICTSSPILVYTSVIFRNALYISMYEINIL